MLVASDNQQNGVRIAAASDTAGYTLTMPPAAPSAAAGYSAVPLVTNSGAVSWLELQSQAGAGNKRLSTDGTKLVWVSSGPAPALVGLSGNRASSSGGTQYVIHSVSDNTYKLQFSTSLNPAALPTLQQHNASAAAVGAAPTAIAVTTTTLSNDTLSFTWTPEPTAASLFVNPFVDAAAQSASNLQLAVTPIADLTVSSLNIDGDAVAHTAFKSGVTNNVRANFSRNLDTGHPNPTITTTPANGTTTFAAYGASFVDLAWTPSTVSGGNSLVISSLRDSLGFTYTNVAIGSLSVLAALTVSTVRARDASSTNRAYAIVSDTGSVVLGFNRNVAKIVSLASTSLPAGAVFGAAPHANSTVGLPGAQYVASGLTTGASSGTATFSAAVEDTNALVYTFAGLSLPVQARLVASGFTTTVNTQTNSYPGVRMDFNRPLVDGLSGLSVTGSSGTVANFSTVSGDFQLDYTAPGAATDTLNFAGIKDDASNDAETVAFAVTGLAVAPVLSPSAGWPLYPNSQAYNYTGGTHKAVAKFNVALASVGNITASSGNDPAAEVVGAGDNTTVEFTWDTSASTSPCTLTFNGLVTASGAVDVAPVESVAITLVAPPAFASWGKQPALPSTAYTGANAVKINFDKALSTSAPAPAVASNLSGAISNVAVAGSQLSFDYTTPGDITGTELAFTVGSAGSPLVAADGGRSASLVIVNGPVITAFNSTAAPDTGNKVLNGVLYNHTITFNKALASAPTLALVGGGTLAAATHATNTVSVDVTAAAGTTALTVTGATPTAGTTGGVATQQLTVVAPAAFAQLELASNPGIALASTHFKVNTAYSLLAAFNKALDTGAANPTASVNAGTSPSVTGYSGSQKLAATWTPNAASEPTDVTITFNGVTDSDNFVRSITATTAYDVQFVPTTVVAQTYPGQASVGNNILSQAGAQVIHVQFSKSLSSAPTATSANATYAGGALSATTVANDTVAYTLTNVSGTGAEVMAFGTVTGADTSTTTGLTVALNRVAPLSVLHVATQAAPSVQVTELTVNTAHALIVEFGKTVSQVGGDITAASLTASSGANPGTLGASTSTRYGFSWTPNTSTSVTLTATNVKDSDGFVTASLQAGPAITVAAALQDTWTMAYDVNRPDGSAGEFTATFKDRTLSQTETSIGWDQLGGTQPTTQTDADGKLYRLLYAQCHYNNDVSPMAITAGQTRTQADATFGETNYTCFFTVLFNQLNASGYLLSCRQLGGFGIVNNGIAWNNSSLSSGPPIGTGQKYIFCLRRSAGTTTIYVNNRTATGLSGQAGTTNILGSSSYFEFNGYYNSQNIQTTNCRVYSWYIYPEALSDSETDGVFSALQSQHAVPAALPIPVSATLVTAGSVDIKVLQIGDTFTTAYVRFTSDFLTDATITAYTSSSKLTYNGVQSNTQGGLHTSSPVVRVFTWPSAQTVVAGAAVMVVTATVPNYAPSNITLSTFAVASYAPPSTNLTMNITSSYNLDSTTTPGAAVETIHNHGSVVEDFTKQVTPWTVSTSTRNGNRFYVSASPGDYYAIPNATPYMNPLTTWSIYICSRPASGDRPLVMSTMNIVMGDAVGVQDTSGNYHLLGSSGHVAGNSYVYAYTSNNLAFSVYRNGASVHSGTMITATPANTAGTIGRAASGFQGDMYQILVYNTHHDAGTVSTITDQLRLTWGVGNGEAARFPQVTSNDYFLFNVTPTITAFECIFFFEATADYQGIVSKNSPFSPAILLTPSAGGTSSLSSHNGISFPDSPSMNEKTWHHFYYNVADGNKVYLDGVSWGAASGLAQTFTTLGRQGDGDPTRQLKGAMYMVRFWTADSRTGAAAYSERLTEKPAGTTGLARQYTFDYNTADSSGNGVDAVWQNGAASYVLRTVY